MHYKRKIKMALEELEEALNENVLTYGRISLAALVNIMTFVKIDLLLDEKTNDYYYIINVEDLLKSAMPKEELEVLKTQGWAFDNDKKTLKLFLINK